MKTSESVGRYEPSFVRLNEIGRRTKGREVLADSACSPVPGSIGAPRRSPDGVLAARREGRAGAILLTAAVRAGLAFFAGPWRVAGFFLATVLVAGVFAAFFETGFFGAGFFGTGFLAAGFLDAGFFAANLFAAGFFAVGFFAAGFFAAGFFAAGFFAVGFFAANLFAAGFLNLGFFATPFLAAVFGAEVFLTVAFLGAFFFTAAWRPDGPFVAFFVAEALPREAFARATVFLDADGDDRFFRAFFAPADFRAAMHVLENCYPPPARAPQYIDP